MQLLVWGRLSGICELWNWVLLHVLPPVLAELARVAFGVGLVAAGIRKFRDVRAFSDTLRWLTGDRGYLGTIVASIEVILGGTAILAPTSWTWIVTVWILLASIYLGAWLAMTSETRCSCWGGSRPVTEDRTFAASLLPAYYALRNFFYIGSSLAVASASLWVVCAAAVVPLVAVGAGLVVSTRSWRVDAGSAVDLKLRTQYRGALRRNRGPIVVRPRTS